MLPSSDTAVRVEDGELDDGASQVAGEPGEAVEVFPLLGDGALDPEDYLTAFFNTGTERQGEVAEDLDEPSP